MYVVIKHYSLEKERKHMWKKGAKVVVAMALVGSMLIGGVTPVSLAEAAVTWTEEELMTTNANAIRLKVKKNGNLSVFSIGVNAQSKKKKEKSINKLTILNVNGAQLKDKKVVSQKNIKINKDAVVVNKGTIDTLVQENKNAAVLYRYMNDGRLQRKWNFNIKKLKNNSNGGNKIAINKLYNVNANKMRVLYTVKKADGTFACGGTAILNLKTRAVKKENKLVFAPTGVDNKYVYGMHYNTVTGKKDISIANIKTGIVEYRFPVAGNQSQFKCKNGVIMYVNELGIFGGKYTDKQLIRVVDFTRSPISSAYVGATYIVRDIAFKDAKTFYVTFEKTGSLHVVKYTLK